MGPAKLNKTDGRWKRIWQFSARAAQAFYVGRRLRKETKLPRKADFSLEEKNVFFNNISTHRAIGIKLLFDPDRSYEIFNYQLVSRYSKLKTYSFMVDDVLSLFLAPNQKKPGEMARAKQDMNDSLLRSEKIAELFSTEHFLAFERLPDQEPSLKIKYDRKIKRHSDLAGKKYKRQLHPWERFMAIYWTRKNYNLLVQAGIISD
jgi:hypothetical protein